MFKWNHRYKNYRAEELVELLELKLLEVTELLTVDDRIVFRALLEVRVLLASKEVLDTAMLLESVVLLGLGELLATAAAATSLLGELLALLEATELLVPAELVDETVLGLLGELLEELLAELLAELVGELVGARVGALVGELLGELITELLTDVPRPVSVVVLLREATDALPESEAASRALTAELLEGSVAELLVDRVARLLDGVELLERPDELWEELAEFEVELSVPEATEELFADVVVVLLDNMI